MSRLHDLYETGGQSPWLDNIKREWIQNGELAAWVERGARGLTSNPSIFQNAIEQSDAYDEQFAALLGRGLGVEAAYWRLVGQDIVDACGILRPVFEASDGVDGYVSVEVSPKIAHDAASTLAEALSLHDDLDQDNLYVKVPGTAEGVEAIQDLIAAGQSINVTLLFGLARYEAVIDAYLTGLEECEEDLESVSSVASFFISRVDTEVDRRLEALGTPEALALCGKVAVANAQLAYGLFVEKFSGPRWEALAARGARVQRPLWASTSAKNPSYSPTLYVDTLIGPDTVNTMPDPTLAEFEATGTVARTVDQDLDGARQVIDRLAAIGVDLDEVTEQLEDDGVAAFEKAFDQLLAALDLKAQTLNG